MLMIEKACYVKGRDGEPIVFKGNIIKFEFADYPEFHYITNGYREDNKYYNGHAYYRVIVVNDTTYLAEEILSGFILPIYEHNGYDFVQRCPYLKEGNIFAYLALEEKEGELSICNEIASPQEIDAYLRNYNIEGELLDDDNGPRVTYFYHLLERLAEIMPEIRKTHPLLKERGMGRS